MKLLLLSLLMAVGAYAQSALTFYVHDTTGHTADTPFPSIYQLNSTPEGSGSPLVLKGINSSTNTIYLSTSYVSNTTGTTDLNPNFSLTGLSHDQPIPPGQSVVFTVNFVPIVTGLITGYLQVAYQIQQSGCSFNSTNPATACPSTISTVSTLTGMATAPAIAVTYPNPDGSGPIVPQAGSTISFGNVATSATSSITFTLTNKGSVTVTPPAVALRVQQFGTPAFALNTMALPTSLEPNASASFVVTFAPGQTGLVSDTYLDVGTNSYSLTGAGVIVAEIDALQIAYVDPTSEKITSVQAATPISFANVLAGSGATSTLTFCVTNPLSSYNAVNPVVTVSGIGFAISTSTSSCQSVPCPTVTIPANVPPGSPLTFTASIPPCQAVAFTLTFTPSAVGISQGALSFADAMASRNFTLNGQSVASPFPGISCQVTPSVLMSQQQATVTVNLAASTTVPALGLLNISFASNVARDPAIAFTNPSGSDESVNIAAGTKSSPAFTFQTGTTAGTITFTLQNFGNTANQPCQSLTIPAAAVQITSGTAARQNPNLVVTLNGYDNTYTVGLLSFTFYDISGKVIGSPISFDATSKFRGYFPTSSVGGAFNLIATFPVTGDVTQVGSVAVTLTNSVGKNTTTQTFQ
jgi:hypothetical protein